MLAIFRTSCGRSAQAHEIRTMGVTENIEQHQRRRHGELDNIFQVKSWIDQMHAVTKASTLRIVTAPALTVVFDVQSLT